MKLLYDISSLPAGMTMEIWYHIYMYFGIVVYDSSNSKEDIKPRIVHDPTSEEMENKIILDLSKELDYKEFKEATGMIFDSYE